MSSATAESAGLGAPDGLSRHERFPQNPGRLGESALRRVAAPTVIATTAAWAALLIVWSPMADKFVWSANGRPAGGLFAEICMRVLLTTGLLAAMFALVAVAAGAFFSRRKAGARRDARFTEPVPANEPEIQPFDGSFDEALNAIEERFHCRRSSLTALQRKLVEIEAGLGEGRLSPEGCAEELHEAMRLLHEAKETAEVRS